MVNRCLSLSRVVLALALVFTVTPAIAQAQGRGGGPTQAQGGPIADLQTRVQTLEQQVAALKTDLDTLSAKVDTQDAALQTQVTTLNGQLAGFQLQLADLHTALGTASGDIGDLQTQVQALEDEVAELTEAAGDLSLATLEGSACVTPTGQEGSMEITQSMSGVAILRCRSGEGRFIDNGDGTITDTQTGLMWETKVGGSGCVRCVDDEYNWNAAMGDWLDRLNGRLISTSTEGGFAGYSDWRSPTLAELRTIVKVGSYPTIDAIFGPTAAFFYWSASTLATVPSYAWGVNFAGGAGIGIKAATGHVRAVRAGP